MFAPRISAFFIWAILLLASPRFLTRAQVLEPAEAVRVTVSLHSDGSRTVYQFDNANHQTTATTTGQDGKPRGRILYGLDEKGRFASGEIFGADNRLRFKSLYKYDAAGRLTQETQLTKENVLRHKIVYAYDEKGKQGGYTIYDATGKVVRQNNSAAPVAAPPNKRPR